MRTRIKDIARELGISESTVSRALSDHPKIKNSTKEKVRQTAGKLNYQPDLIAKSLKMKQTKTIGLIICDITNPFYPEIIKGAEDYANKHNLNIFLCNSDYDLERQKNYLNVLTGKKVDGIIISPTGENNNEVADFLMQNEIPFVLIDIKPEMKVKTNCVYTDNEYGTYIGVSHLIKLGHKKIALINGPHTSPCRQMIKGYLKALNKANIPVNEKHMIVCNLKIEGGYRAVRDLLKLEKEEIPTAAIFISDITALGAYEALHEANLKIPEDFSIVGFDDIPGSKYFSPPLTTIDQPKYELGEFAMKLLVNQLNNNNWEHKHIKILPKLIIRGSTSKSSSH